MKKTQFSRRDITKLVSTAVLTSTAALTTEASIKPLSSLKMKPDWSILRREGDDIFLGDKPFRFLGLAAPNIQQHESQIFPDFRNRFPDEFELRDILESIQAMGGLVTRSFSFSVFSEADNGIPVYISGHRHYNEQAFQSFDLLLKLCKEYNVRILVPIIASQSFPTIRGVDEFAALSGKTTTGAFWTDTDVKNDFKHFLTYLTSRRNTLTGVLYRDDPAILAWQLGNEFDSFYGDRKLPATIWKPIITQWQIEMAAWLKAKDPNHLIMEAGGDRDALANDPNIDLMSAHLYEYWNRVSGQPTDLAQLAIKEFLHWKGKRPLLIDEFGLASLENQQSLIAAIQQYDMVGGLLWSLRSHRRDGGFYYHNEGGTPINSFHYPGFSAGHHFSETRILDLLRVKSHEIRKIPLTPIPAPQKAPRLDTRDGGLYWRGSTGAAFYTIERTTKTKGPWERVADGIHDSIIFDVKTYEEDKIYLPDILWTDLTKDPQKTYLYRVRGANASGVSPWSEPLIIGPQ